MAEDQEDENRVWERVSRRLLKTLDASPQKRNAVKEKKGSEERRKICDEDYSKYTWEDLPGLSKMQIFCRISLRDIWTYRAINRESREIISSPSFRKWKDSQHSEKCLLLYTDNAPAETQATVRGARDADSMWSKLLHFDGKAVVNASYGLVLFISAANVLHSTTTGRVKLKGGKLEFTVYNCLTEESRILPDLLESKSVQEDIRYELFFDFTTYVNILADPVTCTYQVVLVRYVKPNISSRLYSATVHVYDSESSSWSKFNCCSRNFTKRCEFVFLNYKLLYLPVSVYEERKCCYDMRTKEEQTFERYFRCEEDRVPGGHISNVYFYTGKNLYMLSANAELDTMFLYRFYEDAMTFGRLMSCQSCRSSCELFECYEESNEFWAFSRKENTAYCYDIRRGVCTRALKHEPASAYSIGCAPLRLSMVP